ncbi:MAG: DNA polymerase III subunit delta' [Alphaproteobacteria bacterium]
MATESDPEDLPWPHPRANPACLGHEDAEQVVLDAWRSGRMPHAWLISGPEGIGKATFAYRMIRFVLSGGGETQGGGLFGEDLPATSLATDRESSLFQRIAAQGHADVKVLVRGMADANGKPTPTVINAYATRKAVEFAYRTSAEGGYKIILVDPVDDMNPSAANALLKALEEPPGKALFLLVSHRPGGLLPTIRSRCRSLRLSPLPTQTVETLLSDTLPDVDAETRNCLARLSDGSIGRALSLQAAGGLDLYRGFVDLLQGDPFDWATIHTLGDTLARKGSEAAYASFRELVDWWLSRAVIAAARSQRPAEILIGEDRAYGRLLAANSATKLDDLRRIVAEQLGRTDPPANLSKKQVILLTFMTLEPAMRGR